MDCESMITACAMCPNPAEEDEEEETKSYNCVEIHKKAKCPLLAGEELKNAQEKRDNFQEEVKDLEENIIDLEKDITEKQNELNKSLTELEEEFTNTVAEFERETQNAREDLEAGLNEGKTAIKNEVSKQIAQVQEALDKSLEVAHSFENAITEAKMSYRSEQKKLYGECMMQAQVQLAKYRSKRQQSIEVGNYRVSLSDLTSKKRLSFAQRDIIKLGMYYKECLFLKKSDINDLKLVYNQKMRVIQQQKEQYQKRMESLKQKVISLNKMAYEQQNQIVEDYAKKLSGILSNYGKQYALLLQNYKKNKNVLMSENRNLSVLQKHLMEKKTVLEEKRRAFIMEQQLIAYLKSKGVSEENSSEENKAYSSAAGALSKYHQAIMIASDSCDCKNSKASSNSRIKPYCTNIDERIDRMQDSDLELIIETIDPTSGTR